jgi:bacillolysin
MNRLLPLLFILACASATIGQNGKVAPKFKGTQAPETLQLNWQNKLSVPVADNPFNLETPFRNPIGALAPRPLISDVQLTMGENGLPIMMEGQTAASGSAADNKPIAERALDYLASLQPMRLMAPAQEFVVRTVQTDEQGNNHIRMDQVFEGLPVWGGELIAHTKNGIFERVNGRYFPTPKLATTTPALDKTAALDAVKAIIGSENIKTTWSPEELELIDGPQFSAELIIYHPNGVPGAERLAWHIIAHPNILSRTVYFLDAATGEILDTYDNTCNLVGHRHTRSHIPQSTLLPAPTSATAGSIPHSQFRTPNSALAGSPATVQGLDLFNTNRSFTLGGWQVGSTYYLENSNTTMFNSSSSNMPSDPVGVIVTLDGLGNSPENNNFDYTLVTSNSSTFSNKNAGISAHYNAGLSFNYFKSKFNRSSIDGSGGNILSFVNIKEGDGTQMDNAFWNGAAMWYGNGATLFNSLARGLDVGGHEMTHGVVEKTANLVYQNESGALNESFADVFGLLIENDTDWKIGEDVVKPGVSPNGCLRDLSNPHNNATSSSSWWQPNHVNEKYTGTQDNGGVHINSGIPNYAFYLFTTNAAVGKAKAEQVYYKALRDYLTKSSKFVDCRLAVIQAATDLYGATVANVAASAFASVGIGGSAPSGNYQGQLNPNPGTDYVLCVSNNQLNLDLANGSGTILGNLYNQGIKSRPSITDNGKEIVFVNNDDHIIYIGLSYNPNPTVVTTFELSTLPEWRQAAISKDGRYVAALSNVEEPYIYVFDFVGGTQRKFKLYNPTYTTGQVTGDVSYADVLEFDYSGKNLMYDAYNKLINSQGQDLSYWDIGFLEFWDNGQFAPANDAFISKLFAGIPEKTSIGDPAFAKNSPYILAFDYIDQTTSTTRYDVYGANSETGKYDIIVSNNGAQGWPNYNRLDSKLLYEVTPSNGVYNLRVQNLNATKIQPIGGSSLFTTNHSWGVWYGNGNRSLVVGSKESGTEALQLSVAPNPVSDFAQISLTTLATVDAQVSVCNMFGQLLLTRNVTLQQGENVLDYDMSTLPAGSYILRIAAGDTGAAVKMIKG